MLTKILFTGFVILVVYAYYRYRSSKPVRGKKVVEQAKPSKIGHLAVAGFIVLLLLASGGIYLYQWQQAHQVVTIRVIEGASGDVTVYQAYRKSIKGNRFESLDGKMVVLGEAARVEFTEAE